MHLLRYNTLTALAIGALSAILAPSIAAPEEPVAPRTQLDLQRRLLLHFPFQGDTRELVSGSQASSNLATEIDQSPHAAAFLKTGSEMRVSGERAPQLGTDDFTLAMWVRCDEPAISSTGDLISHYDPLTQRGFHLTLKTSTGVTSNQPNYRHLQFGIDDNCEGTWRDCGRPGQSILAFAGIAVEEIDSYLFHQSNRFIMKHIAKKCGLPEQKVPLFLENFGNSGGPSVALALTQAFLDGVGDGKQVMHALQQAVASA